MIRTAEEIFLAALEESSPDERQAFLRRACRDDEALWARVEGLIRAHERAGSFLEGPLFDTAATVASDSTSEGAGTQIGPYRLLEAIGEGGMGTVYMAEQTEPVRRRVALKVIKPGMDSKQVVARFEAERQALAMMDHPNIARVFDGGMTPAGRPYFVMELVRGLPITDYCERARLSIPERLELFVPACRAVQHAHQKGIIHRDLKPSNILVTMIDGAAVPKVIDFGIAKATGAQLTERTLFTGFHQLVGTPLYMSPEQAALSGVDVDTRSDIYSLGVLLYELLTGTTPFEAATFREASFDEIRRILREQEPPTPSSRLATLGATPATVTDNRHADPRRLSRTVRGELDWIVMRALEKDRRRRYETASDFAADVTRYLTDQPVEACPPSLGYQFGKFARRNRAALATAAVVASSLVLGVAISTWQALRAIEAERQTESALSRAQSNYAVAEERRVEAEAQRLRAEERSQLARRAVDEMYTEVAEKWLADRGDLTPLQREFLEKALAFYEAFAVERGEDPEIRFEAARASERVGKIRSRLGLYGEALEAHLQAQEVFERLATEFPDSVPARLALSLSHQAMGVAFGRLERISEAVQALSKAIEIQEALVDELPGADVPRHQLAVSLVMLGPQYRQSGRNEEAERALRRSAELLEGLADEFPDNPAYRGNLALALENLGELLTRSPVQHNVSASARDAALTEVEDLYRRSLALSQRLIEERPGDPDFRQRLAVSHGRLGDVLAARDRMQEAADHGRRSLDILEALVDDSPDQPLVRGSLVISRIDLSPRLAALDRPEEAEEAARLAADEAEELVARFPDVPVYRALVADATEQLGRRLAENGRRTEAEQAFQKALDRRSGLFAEQPDNWAYRNSLAHLYNLMAEQIFNSWDPEDRDFPRAVELAEKAVELQPEEQVWRKHLGMARYRVGDWDGAIASTRRSMELRGDSGYYYQWLVLAAAHARKGEMAEARAWFDRVVEHVKQDDFRPWVAPLGHLYDEAAALIAADEPPTDSERGRPDAGSGPE